MKKFLCSALLILTVFNTHSQPVRNLEKERGYESELAKTDPALVPVFKEATAKMDAGAPKDAASLFLDVVNKAPEFTPAMRRAGMSLFYSGERMQGIQLCEKALQLQRTGSNIISLAQLLANKDEENAKVTTYNPAKSKELIEEGLKVDPENRADYLTMLATIHLQEVNFPAFKTVAKQFVTDFPDHQVSQYFAAIMEAMNENWVASEEHIKKAGKLGMPEAEVQDFLDRGVGDEAFYIHARNYLLIALGIWLFGFLFLYLLGKGLSDYTFRAIEKDIANGAKGSMSAPIRKLYAGLINLAGFYYYISLPVLVVVTIAVVGGIIYLFMAMGYIPIKIVLLLALGVCISLYAMIRAIFTKVKPSDHGEKLSADEGSELYALTTEVAAKMGTTPIHEIRLTKETELAVYERGSFSAKMNNKAERILILGVGVLQDFKVSDFKAILAHEYGHFANRDTAGGAVALRVRKDLYLFYHTLYNEGQAVAWNLSFQFIRLYDFIFRRITNGSTRLQEVMADRVAAIHYGEEAFKNGLTFVIKRQLEFNHLAIKEIEDAKSIKRKFNNLYNLTRDESFDLEGNLNKAITAPTTEEDTHPSPIDRFRYIKGIGTTSDLSDQRHVSDLIKNWNELTTNYTLEIQKSWLEGDVIEEAGKDLAQASPSES